MKTKTKITVFILLMSTLSMLIKLQFSAYGIYGPDSTIHLGISQNIMENEALSLSRETRKGVYDWFFMLHLEAVIVSLSTGIDLSSVAVLFMPIMTFVMNFFIFTLCRKFFDEKTGILGVVIFSLLSVTIWRGSQFIQEMMALVFVICALNYMDVAIDEKISKKSAVFLLFFLGALFSHHLMTLFLFMFVFSYYLVQKMNNKYPKKLFIFLIIIISIIYWYISGFVFYRLLMTFFPSNDTLSQIDIGSEIISDLGYELESGIGLARELLIPTITVGFVFIPAFFLFYIFRRKKVVKVVERFRKLILPVSLVTMILVLLGLSTRANFDAIFYNLDKILVLSIGIFGIFELIKKNPKLFSFFYISLGLIFVLFVVMIFTQSTVISPPRIILYSSVIVLLPCARVLRRVDTKLLLLVFSIWVVFSFYFAFPTIESGRAWFRQYYYPHEYDFLNWAEGGLDNETFVSSTRMMNLLRINNDLTPTRISWKTLDAYFCSMNLTEGVKQIVITEDMIEYGIIFSSFKPTICEDFSFLGDINKIYSSDGGLFVFER